MATYHVSYGVKEINLKMFIVKGECRVVKGCIRTCFWLLTFVLKMFFKARSFHVC